MCSARLAVSWRREVPLGLLRQGRAPRAGESHLGLYFIALLPHERQKRLAHALREGGAMIRSTGILPFFYTCLSSFQVPWHSMGTGSPRSRGDEDVGDLALIWVCVCIWGEEIW